MSHSLVAAAETLGEQAREVPRARVQVRLLLALFLVIPIFAAFIALDRVAFGGRLGELIPRTYPSWVLYLFFAPHVYASTITFLDAEYRREYPPTLWIAFAAIFALTHASYFLFPVAPLLAIYALLTVTHFVNQQAGIAKMLMRADPAGLFLGWRVLLIAGTTASYLAAFGDPTVLDGTAFSTALAVLGAAATGLALAVGMRSRTSRGRVYLAGSHLMFVLAWLYVSLGYPLLGLFAGRIIHDTTAFVFYVAHDTNRNRPEARNAVYRVLRRVGVPAGFAGRWGSLLVAFPLGAMFYASEGIWFFPVTSIALTYFHYYTETFMWKREAPHRRYIAIS